MRFFKTILLSFLLLIPIAGRAAEYRNAVKVTFLSWATGSTKLSYERAFNPHQSGEIGASLIGAGYDKFQNNPRGYTLRYGHKFFVAGNEGGGLKGVYVRPEFIYVNYHYAQRDTGLRTQAQMGTLLATAGYQTHFGRFLVDAWAGLGPAIGTPAETGYHHGFALWNVFAPRAITSPSASAYAWACVSNPRAQSRASRISPPSWPCG